MFEIFGLPIRLYGITAALGIFAATQVTVTVAKKVGFDEEVIWDALLWILLAGLIGARAYHVIEFWKYYSQNPADIVAIWKGGLGIFGAFVTGLVGLWLFGRVRRFTQHQIFQLLDCAVVGMPLGQAIGRWGNYFNQELYGPPTNLPWAIYISPENRLFGLEAYERFHPLFLYESLLNLLLFMILWYWARKYSEKLGSLVFVGLYLIGYSSFRFGLEFLRLERWTWWGPISATHVISLVLIGTGIGLVWFQSRSNPVTTKLQIKNNES